MTKNNYWLKSGTLNLMQNGLTVLLGFLSFYFLVRILDVDDYGAWILFLSATSIIELTRNGLTQDALVKYLSSAEEGDKVKINAAALSINAITTIIIFALIFVFAGWFGHIWKSDKIVVMLHLYTITFLFSGLQSFFNCNEQASLNFTGVFYSNIAKQFVLFAYIFYRFITKTPTDIINLTITQMVGTVIAAVIAFLYARKKMKFNFVLEKEWLKKIFNFGKYTFGTAINTFLGSSIDQMMLGSMLSKSASGIFNIAVRISSLINIPTITIATIVFPQSSRRIQQEGDQSLKHLFEKSVGVTLAILLPLLIGTFAFSDYIIPIVATDKYVQAIPLLKITLLSALFTPYALQSGIILTSAGKTKFNFYLTAISATVMIALNYFFIRSFGIIGAAYATLLSNMIGTSIALFYLKKNYNVNFFSPWIYAFKFYPEFYYTYIKKGVKRIG